MATSDTASSSFAPLFIERCRIRSFRGLEDCEVEFEEGLTLLVGRNNAGKSRVLRALAVALGAPAELDDLTIGSGSNAMIDVVVAPATGAHGSDDVFSDSIAPRIGSSIPILSDDPVKERFAWRTTLRQSSEGMGVRSETALLGFDTERGEWFCPPSPAQLSREQRSLLAVDLIPTQRDLVDDFLRRGSAIRRVLQDLEVDSETRSEIETELALLGTRIVGESKSLAAVKDSLDDLEMHVSGIGAVELNPLPLRLEELSRSVAIDLDHGHGALPMRLQGSGTRSLASIQVQRVSYERRLGMDGPAIRPHPVTLVEEPEAHLHPQAASALADLLTALPGQVVVSTHSPHLVTSVQPSSIRLLRRTSASCSVVDLGPVGEPSATTHRALRADLHHSEMEKLKRLVERPFGDLLFASSIVIGDGSTERAFLPKVLRHALGSRADGVCVVDPGNLSNDVAHAAIKFAHLVGIPWILFSDSDEAGRRDVERLLKQYASGDESRVVFIQTEGPKAKGAAIERMMADFDDELCRNACLEVRPDLEDSKPTFEMLTSLKGSVGSRLSYDFVLKYPDPAAWPTPILDLVQRISSDAKDCEIL